MTASNTATELDTETKPYVEKPGNGQLKFNRDFENRNGKIGYGTFTDPDGVQHKLTVWENKLDWVICNFSITDTAAARLAKENQELRDRLAKVEAMLGEPVATDDDDLSVL